MYILTKTNKKIIISIIIFGIIMFLCEFILHFFTKNTQLLNNFFINLYISTIFFTTISMGTLLFLGIQNVSKSGWSIIINPIMEKISSFIPYGSVIIFLIILLNINNSLHIFNWMDYDICNIKSKKYDEIICNKYLFLNKPFFLIRNIIYLLGCNYFYIKIKKKLRILNTSFSKKKYNNLNLISLFYIIFFSISSILMSWDWIMSLNPHWASTLFGWYFFSSFMTSSISMITIFSIFLNRKYNFFLFNKSHLHDLGTYLFSSSLLWSYFWYSQFLLYWYGNIPEEIIYFFKREKLYYGIHFWILIPNFIIPFLFLISSKNKTNYKVVLFVSFNILIGHYIDIYNLIAPELIEKLTFDLYQVSPICLIGGLFFYILLHNFNNKKINNTTNHPFFKESKNYNNTNL